VISTWSTYLSLPRLYEIVVIDILYYSLPLIVTDHILTNRGWLV